MLSYLLSVALVLPNMLMQAGEYSLWFDENLNDFNFQFYDDFYTVRGGIDGQWDDVDVFNERLVWDEADEVCTISQVKPLSMCNIWHLWI